MEQRKKEAGGEHDSTDAEVKATGSHRSMKGARVEPSTSTFLWEMQRMGDGKGRSRASLRKVFVCCVTTTRSRA